MTTLVIECPLCKNTTPISLWMNPEDKNTYGIENAPPLVLAEANLLSKNDQIECIHCNVSLYIQMVCAAQVRVLSDREREGWKFN